MAPVPTLTDRKLRKQIEAAVAAFDEAAATLASGRRGPRRRGRRVVLVLLGAAATGTAAVLATNEELRGKVLGSAKALGEEISGSESGDATAPR